MFQRSRRCRGFVHFAHTASAEGGLDLVGTERGAGRKGALEGVLAWPQATAQLMSWPQHCPFRTCCVMSQLDFRPNDHEVFVLQCRPSGRVKGKTISFPAQLPS